MKTIRRNRNARRALQNFLAHSVRQTEDTSARAIAKVKAAARDGLMDPKRAEFETHMVVNDVQYCGDVHRGQVIAAATGGSMPQSGRYDQFTDGR